MSITAYPRLYIRGEMSFDPSLSNNFEVYDQLNVALDFAALQAAVPGATTLDQFRTDLPKSLARSWNHFGTHRAVFESSMRVTGVSLASGVVDTADGIVQKQVQMKGKLVDLSPATDNGTQVFFDQLQLGGVGGGLQLARRKRMTCRYLNFARNVGPNPGWPAYSASGTWEVCFAKEGLRIQNAAASPYLTALQELLETNPALLGVALRIRTYRTLYYQNGVKNTIPERPRTGSELRALYADGKNFSNPVYSMVTGTLFPWVHGDHEGHPAGRMLIANAGIPSLSTPRQPVGLGNAFVEFDLARNRMVLDLGDLVPETDQTLTKANIGDIAIVALDGQTTTTLGVISPPAYSQSEYEKTAGLVDVQLPTLTHDQWAALENSTLGIFAENTLAMREQELVVVVEDRDHYVDQGESVSISVRVMLRGRPAPVGTQVLATAYDAQARPPVLSKSLGKFSVNASGEVTIQIGAATAPSIVAIAFRPFLAGDTEPDELPNDTTDFHALIRTLPFDDQLEADTKDAQLTWSWVYENILSVWDVTNPVMGRSSGPAINKPLHDRATMEIQATRIKKLIARTNLEAENYMPVTRDLSRGKRRLLERWCDLVIAGTAPHELPKSKPINVRTMSQRVFPEE